MFRKYVPFVIFDRKGIPVGYVNDRKPNIRNVKHDKKLGVKNNNYVDNSKGVFINVKYVDTSRK